MGHFIYGSEAIEMPDSLLAHLKVVMTTKLRRNECFTVSWHHATGAGRSTVWLHPAIDIRFRFDSTEPETLDVPMLQDLARQADTNAGILLGRIDPSAVAELEPAA